MNHLPLIIKREYWVKVRNKSFVIMTILTPLLVIGLMGLVVYLSTLSRDKVRHISVLDESGVLSTAFKNTEHMTYNILDHMPLKAAKSMSQKREDYGLLYIKNVPELTHADAIAFYSVEPPSLTVVSDLERVLNRKLTSLALQKNGVDPKVIQLSKAHVNIDQQSFQGEKTSKVDSALRLGFGAATAYLLFMFIIIYGNMIMRSVIEEKTSRIIEVLISSVKPLELMLGKIIGTSLVGLTQFLIWAIMILGLSAVASSVLGLDMSASSLPIESAAAYQSGTGTEVLQEALVAFFHLPLLNLILAFITFFMGGYLLYSALYVAIGAAVDSETDTQQFIFPVMIPLILSIYIGFSTVIEDPHGTISVICSFIPFTSSVIMLMRIPFGVPIWQQVLALLVLIGTFVFVVWFAAKIYRVGILMYGKKPSYKELMKWLKY